ncbi:hypothetical protein [Chitinophaga sp. XS-30]|uniref:hypothetical protein n=1 Tax=Chitinophaga sp. XS-30 TaxID=2604421 RepID=UPI0011DC9A68|nr:hypothetical protein [Chitinophaga sp. XS-30]QEH39415.1 hypothetical protein FW415_00420 [Chitinophaga sp. XS-30]
MQQVISSVLVYSQFYPDPTPQKDVSRLLKWDRDMVLRMLISIKLVCQHMSRNHQHSFAEKLIQFLPPQRDTRLDDGSAIRITNKTVVLKIMADLLNQPCTAAASDVFGAAFYRDILNTILIYNEHQFPYAGLGNQKLRHIDAWTVEMMQELNAENVHAYARIGGIKQLIYIQFLKEKFGNDYPAFEQEVVSFTGLSSMYEIALLFMNLEIAYQKAIKNDVPIVVIGNKDVKYPLLCRLDLVTDATVHCPGITYERLFTAPFLKLNDDHLYLIGTTDFDLITTKSWDYYLVKNRLFEKYLSKVNSVHVLKGIWGKEYIESFLSYRLLKSLETKGIRVLPSDDRTKPDVTLIVNEKDVFMIEVKSAALNNRITSAKDIDGFKDFIDKNVSGSSKGVAQLNRNIEFLAEYATSAYNLKTPISKLRIYPIIVYTDHHLSKQAVNDYVIANCPNLPQSTVNKFQSIENVTLIHLDFFLENILLLKKDRSLLRNLICDYHRYVRRTKKNYDNKERHKDFFSAMVSFETWSVGYNSVYQDNTTEIFSGLAKIYNLT